MKIATKSEKAAKSGGKTRPQIRHCIAANTPECVCGCASVGVCFGCLFRDPTNPRRAGSFNHSNHQRTSRSRSERITVALSPARNLAKMIFVHIFSASAIKTPNKINNMVICYTWSHFSHIIRRIFSCVNEFQWDFIETNLFTQKYLNYLKG